MSISAEGKTVFKLFDTASKSFGKETPVSDNARMLYAGNDIYRYFYTNGSDLFGERRDSGEVEKVVDWLACDIDSGKISTDRLGFFSDGRIAAVSHDFSENGAGEQIVVLRRVDASEVPQKTELTLAASGWITTSAARSSALIRPTPITASWSRTTRSIRPTEIPTPVSRSSTPRSSPATPPI